MSQETIGRRVLADAAGYVSFADLRPGDYFLVNGEWTGVTPNGYHCNLRGHAIEEHEDGTITVTPSILVSLAEDCEVWHGFLESGVWREC
jgi:uncharacterized surface anchored protein